MCEIFKPYTSYSFNSPNDGIVHFFNNIKEYDFTHFISANGSTYDVWGLPKTVINYSITKNSHQDQWVSPRPEDQAYLLISLEYPIYLTHYTIRTRTIEPSESFPSDWTVKTSMDNDFFTDVDIRTNDNHLHAIGAFHTYECTIKTRARYIKFHLNKKTLNDYYYFHISRIELYGRLYIPEDSKYLCNYIFHSSITHNSLFSFSYFCLFIAIFIY